MSNSLATCPACGQQTRILITKQPAPNPAPKMPVRQSAKPKLTEAQKLRKDARDKIIVARILFVLAVLISGVGAVAWIGNDKLSALQIFGVGEGVFVLAVILYFAGQLIHLRANTLKEL
jgi:hypothetical protein